MWPGLVGKGDEDGQEPPISLERMLDFSAAAEVNGRKFDGIDYFLFLPHTNPEASDDELKNIADLIVSKGFDIGSLVAPVWPGTVGDSAMGTDEQQEKFLEAVKMACRIAKVFNEHGARKGGVIRIDSAEFGVDKWKEQSRRRNSTNRIDTLRRPLLLRQIMVKGWQPKGKFVGQECIAGKICSIYLKEWVCLIHWDSKLIWLILTFTSWGYNAPDYALLKDGYADEEFWPAYEQMTDKLRPWTIDFHVAQNDGQVHGAGSHDKTGKHCPADDPNGKLDITRCSQYWLKDFEDRGIKHICWDGCMFPNSTLENPDTWNAILKAMIGVVEA